MVNYLYQSKSELPGNTELNSEVLYRLPSSAEYKHALEYFSGNEKIIYTGEKSPVSLKVSKEISGKFIINNISELVGEDMVTGKNWRGEIPAEIPNDHTGFRCICEVKN